MNRLRWLGFVVLLQGLLWGCSGGSSGPSSELRLASLAETAQVDAEFDRDHAFSFVVVGCNRINAADVTPDNPSTANREQLNRTFREVAALRPLPRFMFFAGDLILGYTDDPNLVERELSAWRDIYEASPLADADVRLVAIPGNHEVQGASSPRRAYRAAEEVWLRVMEPYIVGSNGPGEGGEDGLSTDQSRLTYSFDYRGTHFLILSTDPVDRDWRVPWHWVGRDLDDARARGARHIFAIGHKPAYPWPGAPDDGLSMYPDDRDQFWSSLEANHGEAMLTAHNHLWYKHQPTAGSWQIIAGNGGSFLEAGVIGDDAYFGFTLVTITHHGRVLVRSIGRDVPAEGYLEPSDAYPTSLRDRAEITWQ